MAIITVFTASSFFLSMRFTDQSMTKAMEQELQLALDIADTVVTTRISLLKSDAATIAERLSKTDSAQDMEALMEAQMEAFADVASLAVFSRSGLVVQCGEPISPNVFATEREYMLRAFDGESILSSVHYDALSGAFILHVFVPMDSDRLLSMTVPGMIFSGILSEYSLWQTGSIFLTDASGTFIANYRSSLVLEQRNFAYEAASDPALKSAGEFYQAMIAGDHGTGVYLYENQERLCVYKRVTGSKSGWYIGVAAPLAESPVRSTRDGLLFAAALFLAAGALISVFVSRVVIKPFQKIQAQNRNLESLNQTVQAQTSQIMDEHEKTKLLLDATPLSCRLWNRAHQIFDCNDATVKLYGMRDKEEYIARYYELSPEFQPDGANSLEKTQRILEQVFMEGRYVFEWMHQLPDGTPLPAEVTLVRVRLGDEDVIAGYTRDLREQKRMTSEIERRDRLLYAGNTGAAILLSAANEDAFEASLLKGMSLIGRSLDTDRIQIWRNETIDGELYCVQAHCWYNEDAHPRIPFVPPGFKFPYSQRPAWLDTFTRGEYINSPVSRLSVSDQAFLSPYGTVSVVLLPLFVQDRLWGLFSIDDCSRERVCSDDEIDILRSYSLMMVSALQRNDMMRRIREAGEHTALLLDAMPFVCSLWDKDMNVFACNEEALRMFGLKDKREFVEHFSDLSPVCQPDGRPSSDASLLVKQAYQQGRGVFEWMHQKRDGTPIPAEVTLVRVAYNDGFVVAAYIRDLREQKKTMLEINHNVAMLGTLNKAANTLLRSETDAFASDLNHCMEMIAGTVDVDRISIWSNFTQDGLLYYQEVAEWANTGSSPENPAGLSADLKEPRCYSRKVPGWEETLSRGEPIGGWVEEMADGPKAYLKALGIKSVFITPVHMQDQFWGFVAYDDYRDERVFSQNEQAVMSSGALLIANALFRNLMMLNIRDASVQLEAALNDAQRANQTKSTFLARMSHEMRTPLNAIIGLSELSLETGDLHGDDYGSMEKINNAGMTLLSTVNDILDISKIEAGKFELVPVVYDVSSLINDTVTQCGMYLGEKPIRFELIADETLPSQLYGDELRVKQILNNLLSNAFKYTQEGVVELNIRSAREGDTVLLTASVRDTGMGIRPENIDRMFTDYTQMDMQANRKIMGTGLGLSIAKRMIDLMKGEISVQSEFGKGSTFTVMIPQKCVGDTVIGRETAKNLSNFYYFTQRRKQNANLVRISLPYARVLIVDDMITNLDVAKGIMKPYGMKIDCLTGGQQAIDAIRLETVRYNAVFMDHMMPGMDGIEATRKIREIGTEYAAKVPIIALTANAVAGNEEMFLGNGFQAFISKPIDIARLDTVIRQWVRDREQERLYYEQRMNEEIGKVTDTADQRRKASDRRSGIDRRALSKGISGLDIEKGMERFSGDEEAYFSVLKSFVANTPPLLESVKGVSKENLADYAIILHGIKGASRGIGAFEFSDIAQVLEKAAKADDYEFIRSHSASFLAAAWKLISEMDDMIMKVYNDNPKPKKEKPDAETLTRLLSACVSYEMDSVDTALTELECFEYESGGELVSWLRENVEDMNFAQIIARLSGMEGQG
jgi:signal transduction histidine kinase/DNA-binding response OmpR family regulator/PAS domain-containing protein/HPt (histidine-containing phosphotransfer) domain-containing protein